MGSLYGGIATEISKDNIEIFIRAGRSRWKSENKCFNTLTNQGYY